MRSVPPTLAVVLLFLPVGVIAQTASIAGTVNDSATAAPLSAAYVQLRDAAGAAVWTARSDQLGRFRASGLEPGVYTLTVALIGHRPARLVIELGAVDAREIVVTLGGRVINLDPVVVTASGREEALLDAPAAVSVVERETLESKLALTSIEYITALPGTQVVSGGLMTRRYATRGPNRGSPDNVRTMTDFRHTVLPSIFFNADYLVSTTAEDIARVELVRGPASVLYGPNSSRGALNLLTRSPIDDTGTSIALAGGERSTFQGTVRHASALGNRVGFKISGEYFRGDDWPQPLADAGLLDRAEAIADGADPDTLLLGRTVANDERFRGDVRIEWRPDDRTTAVFAAGIAQATVFDPVSFSGVEAALEGVRTWFLQGRAGRGALKLNLFYNKNDFGDAWFPTIGLPLRDFSSSAWGQIQHGVTLGSRQSFTYGGEIGRTVGSSEGTLLGGNEDIAALTEIGAFLTSSTQVTNQVELLAAARLDYNSVIGSAAVSPWLSAIYHPNAGHALRVAVSRSFSTTGVQVWFSDFAVAPLGPLPYQVRVGPSFEEQTFRRDCGGLCMRSPFNPESAGGPSVFLPTDATTQWAAVVALLQAQGTDISGLPAPTAADVNSVLATLDLSTGFQPSAPSDVVDIAARERLWTNAIEVGYKALIGDRLRAGVDVWIHRSSPLATPAEILTPSVFFDRASLEAYLAQFVPGAQAAALASAIAGIPVGTVTPEQQNQPTDLQRGSRVGGEITYWGMDFDLTVAMTPELSTTATYSWVSQDSLAIGLQRSDYVFNNPKNRASLALHYVNARVGFNGGIQGRFVQSYPAINGSQRGRLDSYTIIDAVVGYRIPRTNIMFTVTAYNLFDDVHQELPETALIGRHVLGGVRATF